MDHMPPLDKLNVTSPQAIFSDVTPGTFRTLGIPLRAGRDFNDADTYQAPFAAIVNEALVKRSFPGQDPIGRTICLRHGHGFPKRNDHRWRRGRRASGRPRACSVTRNLHAL